MSYRFILRLYWSITTTVFFILSSERENEISGRFYVRRGEEWGFLMKVVVPCTGDKSDSINYIQTYARPCSSIYLIKNGAEF